ncbi:unannotated protein [freshwater metagenome]|uniref:histidine kinase n=1 Tax=freshwater metagenome TaxID=449393 RepID=A0A6J6INL2_9ZZZZ|nr:hypothetical protein [Actinomycetota bacterium]
MIRWIQRKNWIPEILLATFVFVVFGALDFATQGLLALLCSLVMSASLLFIRRFSFLTSALVLIFSTMQVSFSLLPVFALIGLLLVAFATGSFSQKPWREVNYVASVFGGLAFAADLAFNPTLDLAIFGGTIELTEAGRALTFVIFGLLAISMITLMWIFGQLLISRLLTVGSDIDRLAYEKQQLALSIQLAEQSKRFEIAGEINESVVQRISSVITNAEGGLYAAKASPEAAVRALEKTLSSAKYAHADLRRLFDMINLGEMVSSAPPSLEDLDSLTIAMRETGLDVSVSYFGARFALDQSAELAIYRIIFEALLNAKRHNPKGTKATIEISWLENGFQVLVKDNGVEVERKSALGANGMPLPYDVEDDIDSLLEKVTGPGITAMRERAESFGGSLEVQRAVGVGFTVSATFPVEAIRAAQDTSA